MIACLSATGGFSASKIHNQASVGQQLQNLEPSDRDGGIAQKEYERMKKDLIREND